MGDVKREGRLLRVGVVGLGVGRLHVKAYRQLPDVEVVAIADANPDRLQEIGEAYGVPHRYDDYHPLVERDDLDVVSVCTPNYLHAPVAIAALRHGKHVLCEKPLARTVAEGEEMVEAAMEAGRVLQVVFNHRRRGDVQTLKAYVEQGGLGRVYYAKAWWLRRRGIPGLDSWFTSREMAGGGPLIDLGVHMLDMALYLMGEPQPTAVSAATYAELGTRGRGGHPRARKQKSTAAVYEVEDLATAFIRMADRATLWLETAWAAYRADNDEFGVQLYGTEGGAEIRVVDYAQEGTLTIYTDVVGVPARLRPRTPRGEGHVAAIRDFVEIVRSGAWAEHVGLEGLMRTRIIEACYRSASEGREIAL